MQFFTDFLLSFVSPCHSDIWIKSRKSTKIAFDLSERNPKLRNKNEIDDENDDNGKKKENEKIIQKLDSLNGKNWISLAVNWENCFFLFFFFFIFFLFFLLDRMLISLPISLVVLCALFQYKKNFYLFMIGI